MEATEAAINEANEERSEHLSGLRHDHRRLVEVAIQSFAAIKTGNVGMTGATGALLMHALTGLQSLAETPLVDKPKDDTANRTTGPS